MAEYSWVALLADHGTTEAAYLWLRQNAKRGDTLTGGSQELLDLMWRESPWQTNYREMPPMETGGIIGELDATTAESIKSLESAIWPQGSFYDGYPPAEEARRR
ncbi:MULTISPECIES: hypothetical protein [unclassified Mycobacteroides]|jgi:hypothetical protein|uniref:hypothetical protein n=1 Tax=unclassified Mycobacteroides TaxID=2618759 RepID=UPI00071349DC|nr:MULTISPECIES: hypothetical protein [unclassified Mycobacteroides]KRQ27188.1 hypothetical protein AOT87_04410 [Mycobacteroides sp. H003]KRQ32502.1 hypothetical protein AOT91_11450 [Mycobacteroides sp. H092]KRQ42152.1 hypothetical protein AOT88_25655 [Mycobacteroides sp. H063]KRQ43663.1 hypothetical protein AOT92_07885 [Mycobacteroides sp. H101]KRQ54388.1 hypothetical protein AOT94_22920 [Mycobacteroides sp. HXVII]